MDSRTLAAVLRVLVREWRALPPPPGQHLWIALHAPQDVQQTGPEGVPLAAWCASPSGTLTPASGWAVLRLRHLGARIALGTICPLPGEPRRFHCTLSWDGRGGWGRFCVVAADGQAHLEAPLWLT